MPQASSLPAPPLVIYHGACPDGFAAAWVYWQVLGDRARYLPAFYGRDPPGVAGEDVRVVDFSFPRDVVLALKARARSFRLLDHHASAQRDIGDLPGMYFDLTRSGVGLAWQDLHGQRPLPDLARLVQARNLHQPLADADREVLAVLDALPHDFRAWQALADRLQARPESVRAEGRAMRQQFEALLDRLEDQARPVRMGDFRGLAANAPREFATELGHRLAARADFGFTWFLDGQGKIQASWRSATMDVIALARGYGGGGHCQAAGARLSLEQLAAVLWPPDSRASC